jgi:metallo-beta-lactamase family protein
MAKIKQNTDGVYFLGESSADVTGSQYLVQFGGKKILLECGLYQSKSNSYLDSYKINSKKFAFNPSEIDYLFVGHAHIDHCGLIPRLVAQGFKGKIITTKKTAAIMKSLLFNCSFIIADEARILSKRYNRDYSPIYNEDDVCNALKLVETYDNYNEIIHLDDIVSFQWLHNSHCVGSAQLQLILNDELKTRKILYTSDIGSMNTKNHYVNNTEIPSMFNDIVIMESTYGDKQRVSKKSRDFDIEHLRVAVETVLDRKGTLLFPCFSFNRTQELLTILYLIFGNDSSFKADVVVDSKLSCEISELYETLLKDDDLELWMKVKNWDNVVFISEKEESRACINDNTPKIVISSSGFCTNGRIINYLQKYLPDSNSMVVFSGYVGDNPSYLSYRIKNYKDYKNLTINKVSLVNRADCITLSTFSSHANRDDLIQYGSSLNTNKLILVHGSEESKKSLSESLKKAIYKNDKTYKVVCSNKEMRVSL